MKKTACTSGQYYTYGKKSKCLQCNVACEECYADTISNCLKCRIGYYLYKDSCLDTCPDQYLHNKYI